jgi:hypothetical protein
MNGKFIDWKIAYLYGRNFHQNSAHKNNQFHQQISYEAYQAVNEKWTSACGLRLKNCHFGCVLHTNY